MSSRFEGEVLRRLASHLQILLEGMVAQPEQRLGYLPLLTEAERQQVLLEWNATSAASTQNECLPARFEEQAERTPDAVALVWAEEQVTYATLNRLRDAQAHGRTHHRADQVVRGLDVGHPIAKSFADRVFQRAGPGRYGAHIGAKLVPNLDELEV